LTFSEFNAPTSAVDTFPGRRERWIDRAAQSYPTSPQLSKSICPKDGPLRVQFIAQFLRSYKLQTGGFACLFLAIGGVLQQSYDDVDIDWYRATNDMVIGASMLGAAFKSKEKPPA
jgi:hypothetical protein